MIEAIGRNKGFARLGLVVTLVLAGMLIETPSLHAVVFTLTSDHCTGGCGPGPFGTVTLTQNGTTVDVTVHLNSNFKFVKTGSVDFLAFKFNATGVVLTDITVNQTVPGQTLAAQTGTFNGDGTGDFSFGIACTTCGGGASDAFQNDIVFHVASATIADLTHPNSDGNIFVADVINLTTGRTGPVDVSAAPEPASFVLLGCAFMGMGLAARRLRRKE